MTLFSGYFWDFGYFQLQLNFSSQKLSDDFCALGKYFILPSMLSSFCLRSSLKRNKLCHRLSCVRCELVFLSESHCFNQVPVYSVQIDDDYAICFEFSSTVPECLRQSLITINPSATLLVAMDLTASTSRPQSNPNVWLENFFERWWVNIFCRGSP